MLIAANILRTSNKISSAKRTHTLEPIQIFLESYGFINNFKKNEETCTA